MDVNSITWGLVLFNYYSFGSLLVVLTTLFFGIFFISLKNRTVATTHFGIGFLLFAIFEIGYFIAALLYHPIASYHRWITGGFILPALTHYTQFLIRFPGNSNEKLANGLLYIQYTVIFIVVSIFIYLTGTSQTIYHFTAHHWDFNAYDSSRYLAFVIAIWSVIGFIIIPIWRIIFAHENKRSALIFFMIGFLVAAIWPNVSNVLSRDGVMERSTYMTSNVISFIAAFSVLAIAFIDYSTERTTFMVKIVGITLYTICLIMQALVFLSNQEKDAAYDNLKIASVERVVAYDKYSDDIVYAFKWNDDKETLQAKSFKKNFSLNLKQVEIDLHNVTIYEEIKELSNNNFSKDLRRILDRSHSFFAGYKNLIQIELENKYNLNESELKNKILEKSVEWNKLAFVASNKIEGIPDEGFCEKGKTFISQSVDAAFGKEIISFWGNGCIWKGKTVSKVWLRNEILNYFRYFKPSETRHYRRSLDEKSHYVAFMKFSISKNEMTEVGFSYKQYRVFMHPAAVKQTIILGIVIFIVLVLFPLFFKSSLVTPLNSLLDGVEKVNAGDLNVVVPVKVRDEIGFLANSFNAMVTSIRQARKELEDYALHLEEKVQERTQEVQEKMEEVQMLKVQQDGDYFLTSLLSKPLVYNANKSELVKTEFSIHQKKQFEFRGKHSELGGDICVTGNLRIGNKNSYKRYTVAMNGDAMGKSMQGAGGALVMGVIINSILARSAANDRIIDIKPEQWLTDVYHEIHSVFKSFNGSMVISTTIFLIEDETGKSWYFNAEHPFTVLYRDGKASFIEDTLKLRKMGFDSEFEFAVHTFQLLKGDILILGTDGRDDIDLTPDQDVRTINEDDKLFLKHVEKANANLKDIESEIVKTGELTDDLSFLKIEFQTVSPIADQPYKQIHSKSPEAEFNSETILENGKNLFKNGRLEEALQVLKSGYEHDSNNPNLNKLLGILSFKGKDYTTAIEVLNKYLAIQPSFHDYWHYLSMANKLIGKYEDALSAALKLAEADPENLSNLINLSDIYRLQGQYELATEFAERVISKDPENKNAIKLLKLIEKNS